MVEVVVVKTVECICSLTINCDMLNCHSLGSDISFGDIDMFHN